MIDLKEIIARRHLARYGVSDSSLVLHQIKASLNDISSLIEEIERLRVERDDARKQRDALVFGVTSFCKLAKKWTNG